MKLIFESNHTTDYLKETTVINYTNSYIQNIIKSIKEKSDNDFERARLAFVIARDEIHHSFDTKDQLVTITAEQALKNECGICFAKAHTLATLLRGMEIPCGFCYQRVLRKPLDTASGFALHGLNALYLKEFGWFRVDPRGNKPGIDSQFNAKEEQLAYVIHPDLGEVDYPKVFVNPLPSVLEAMETSKSTQELFFNRPETI